MTVTRPLEKSHCLFITLSPEPAEREKIIMSNRRRRRKAKPTRPPRKTRSLQKDLNLNSPESAESTHTHQQLNLFPLHPEEKEDVACFFDTDATSTLNGLEWSNPHNISVSSASGEEESRETGTTGTSSLLLERSALKGVYKERDLSEEKWVCYEEVTSCSVLPKKLIKKEHGSLLLKLDYEQIINAWSDKGPLCIDGAQIVPDVFDDDPLGQDFANVLMEAGNVPQLKVPNDGSNVMEGTDGDVWKLESRQARVLRYREKRQNRLFAKRIRYEVRKLNAEKRPRMKGRFVKRVEG